ncbi:MAG: hypothetical protein IID18_08940 [Nitrospinae bacterium]|nr:hypothetical protein [Nitrospinota bacterium]
MVDPVQGIISRLFSKETAPKSLSKSDSGGETVPVSGTTDSVDFNADSLIDALRVQASVLKSEFPLLIANALLAPVADQATRSLPLNAILFRLQNPLESVLGKLPQEELTEELIQKLQEEINKFKIALPSLKDEQILAQFSTSQAADPLNEILSSLSNQVGDLALKLDQLI